MKEIEALANNKKLTKNFAKDYPLVSQVDMIGNRVPPHSKEAEISVLGAMMLDKGAVAKAVEMLEVDSFYYESHKKIFDVMCSMFENSISIDIYSLAEELHRRKLLDLVGGTYYLSEINNSIATAANIDYHTLIVQGKYLKRLLIKSSGQILTSCYEDARDVLEEIDLAERLIFEIADKRFSRSYMTLEKIAQDAYQHISMLKDRSKLGAFGVPTGFTYLDDLLAGGFQKSDLVIIAARPSMGKTALGLSIARNIAVEYKLPVGFFSIEMSAIQLVIRLISAEARIDQQRIRTGKLGHAEMSKIVKTLGRIAKAPLIIDDSPSLNIMEFRAKCRRMRAEHDVQAVFIDYLQLIHPPKAESREREISIISRSLKQIAKELDIPIIALAQLNRLVESRKDKRPMLSDLRESGSIEQDSDVVLFINRPEMYGIKTFDDQSPTENKAEIIIGKQRNGPVGDLTLAYLKDFARFENLAYEYEKPAHLQSNDYTADEEDERPF